MMIEEIGSIAVKTGFSVLFKDIVGKLPSKILSYFENLPSTEQRPNKKEIDKLVKQTKKIVSKTENIYQNIENISKVNTIWQIDKPVDLRNFYFPSNVIKDGERVEINSFSEFGPQQHLVIEGIAGQGKSIFLRYLCVHELGKGELIPIFLELNKINRDQSLMDRIKVVFKSMGLLANDTFIELLFFSGKVLLLLDAFDEIQDQLKISVLNDLEDLISSERNLKMIVTSRPHSKIQLSTHFQTFRLDYLNDTEYQKYILKLSNDKQRAMTIIQQIKQNKSEIVSLLNTPLMITLLLIQYKSYSRIPDSLDKFYSEILGLLLSRHDGTKPTLDRTRLSGLNDFDFRKVFEEFCFYSKANSFQVYKEELLYEYSKSAMDNNNIKANPQSFIRDVVKITCLILRDGNEYRFIHKSVQEFYTASFLKARPTKWIKDFLGALINDYTLYQHFGAELNFLQGIDRYRYLKYFYIPINIKLFGFTENELKKGLSDISLKRFFNALNGISFHFYIELRRIFIKSVSHNLQFSLLGKFIDQAFISKIIDLTEELGIFDGSKRGFVVFFDFKEDRVEYAVGSTSMARAVFEAHEKSSIDEQLIKYYLFDFLNKSLKAKLKEIHKVLSYIKQQEDNSTMRDILKQFN